MVHLDLDLEDARVLDRVLHELHPWRGGETEDAVDRIRAYVAVRVALATYDEANR